MKKSILAMCSVVAISGAGLAAQQPSPTTPPTQQTPPTQPAQRPPDPSTPTTQPPTTSSPTTSSPTSGQDMARTSVTVTGCLKTWDSRTMAPATGAGSGAGSAAATTSTTPASPGTSAQFVLTNVEGATGASRAAGSSFLLKTSDSSVSFSQHLNHKVQVTGTLSDSGRSTSSATDRAADKADKPSTDRDASASGRVSSGDMNLPTLNVTALKMISPTCGTGS
jgi:hypothetical protein